MTASSLRWNGKLIKGMTRQNKPKSGCKLYGDYIKNSNHKFAYMAINTSRGPFVCLFVCFSFDKILMPACGTTLRASSLLILDYDMLLFRNEVTYLLIYGTYSVVADLVHSSPSLSPISSPIRPYPLPLNNEILHPFCRLFFFSWETIIGIVNTITHFLAETCVYGKRLTIIQFCGLS